MPGKIPTGLAVPYEDDTIGVWDVAAAASLLHAPGERWQFVWSSDSTLLALLERRGVGCEVVLWNIAQRERTLLAKFSNRVPDKTRLATTGDDGEIMIWDAHTGEILKMVQRDRPYERMVITGLRGVTDTQKATLLALGAIDKIEFNQLLGEHANQN